MTQNKIIDLYYKLGMSIKTSQKNLNSQKYQHLILRLQRSRTFSRQTPIYLMDNNIHPSFPKYSRKVLTKMKTSKDIINDKPPWGCWFYCGIDWYLTDDAMGSPCRGHVYTFEIDNSKMLVIKNSRQLLKFYQQYHVKDDKHLQSLMESYIDNDIEYKPRVWKYPYLINWSRVYEDYQGIVICPYQDKNRMEHLWYYSWDHASGCIWNPELISNVEYLTQIKGTKSKYEQNKLSKILKKY